MFFYFSVKVRCTSAMASFYVQGKTKPYSFIVFEFLSFEDVSKLILIQ